MNKRGFATLAITTILFGIIIVTGLVYHQQINPVQTENTIDPTPTVSNIKQISYELNRINLRGESEPDLKIKFESTISSTIEYTSENKKAITISDGNVVVTISAPTESGFQAQYTEPPQIDTITNMLGLSVKRIKSEINGYPNYHYTNGYDVKADGGCEAHPGNDIKACDSGQIDFKQNDISHPITVGCNAASTNGLEFCDSIVSSLTYEFL